MRRRIGVAIGESARAVVRGSVPFAMCENQGQRL